MPRIAKCRRVCAEPRERLFQANCNKEAVILQVEEFESIRLVDYEGLEQNVAAQTMSVSRGTFQRILYAARQKMSCALVEGRSLIIEGGNYEVAGAPCDQKVVCQCCRFKRK